MTDFCGLIYPLNYHLAFCCEKAALAQKVYLCEYQLSVKSHIVMVLVAFDATYMQGKASCYGYRALVERIRLNLHVVTRKCNLLGYAMLGLGL